MPRIPGYISNKDKIRKELEEISKAEHNLWPKNIANIKDLKTAPYPSNVVLPDLELNFPVEPGRFRYHRGFLLQFKDICTEKPISLVTLDSIGVEPREQGARGRGGARTGGRHGEHRASEMGADSAQSLQHPAVHEVGVSSGHSRPGSHLANFKLPPPRVGNNRSRFEGPDRDGFDVTPAGSVAGQEGANGEGSRKVGRTRIQRPRERSGVVRAGTQVPSDQTVVPFPPLERSDNRWVATCMLARPQQIEENRLMGRKVKALLNKLTARNFDSISDQIIEWVNKPRQEMDGAIFLQVVKLVIAQAKEGPVLSETYARLCHKMEKHVSPKIQDKAIRNPEGQPIAGGMQFRRYLWEQCQEEFESGWNVTVTTMTRTELKPAVHEVAKFRFSGGRERGPHSDECYTKAKANLQGVGLSRLIGELFKLQMLVEHPIHECVNKLLSNDANPKEGAILGLCALMTMAGQTLDKPKARDHVDAYFERVQDMSKNTNMSLRMRFILLDIIELRARHWQPRPAVPRPIPIPLRNASFRNDSGQQNIARDGFRRGEQRSNNTPEPDGWNVSGGAGTSRPAMRAGDLFQFGKILRPTGLTFGPSSVFSKRVASTRNSGIGSAGGTNMFSVPSQGESDGSPPVGLPTNGPERHGPGPSGPPTTASNGGRKKLNLLPRTKPNDERQ